HISRGELAELLGADDLQDRFKHVFVLLDRLGRSTFQPVRQPVHCSLAYRVVRVTRLRNDSLVEFPVQFSELVHDGGLGLAAGLPSLPSAVFRIPQRELTAPEPWAMSVAFRVAAGTPMLEGDPVFTAPPPGDHGGKASRRWGR